MDHGRRSNKWRFIGLAVLIGAVVAGGLWGRSAWLRQLDNTCRLNARTAQAVIWHFALNDDRLPTETELSEFFNNPPDSFRWDLNGSRPQRNPFTGFDVKFVSYADREPGALTYIPIPSKEFEWLGPQFASRYGYYLICYGRDRHGGMDIDGDGAEDGVLLVLSSADDVGRGQSGPVWVGGLYAPPDSVDTAWKAVRWQAEGAGVPGTSLALNADSYSLTSIYSFAGDARGFDLYNAGNDRLLLVRDSGTAILLTTEGRRIWTIDCDVVQSHLTAIDGTGAILVGFSSVSVLDLAAGTSARYGADTSQAKGFLSTRPARIADVICVGDDAGNIHNINLSTRKDTVVPVGDYFGPAQPLVTPDSYVVLPEFLYWEACIFDPVTKSAGVLVDLGEIESGLDIVDVVRETEPEPFIEYWDANLVSPAMIGGTLVLTLDGRLVLGMKGRKAVDWCVTGLGVLTTDAVVVNGNFVIAGNNGHCVALDPDGGVVWDTEIGSSQFTRLAANGGGLIAAAVDKTYIAILDSSGSLLGRIPLPSRPSGSPVIDESGAVYIALDSLEIVKIAPLAD